MVRMSGLRSRRKGHNYERELARLFKKHFPHLDIKRGLGQVRGGNQGPDVEMPMFWIEAKRHLRCNVKAALRQAVTDSSADKQERIPVAICKNDREEYASVSMRLDDFIIILEKLLP